MTDKAPTGSRRGLQRYPAEQILTLALPALAAGLFLGRVWCERGTHAWSWPALALWTGLGLAAGLALVLALRRGRLHAWPLLLLAAYILWPQADHRMALAVAVVSTVTLILAGKPSRRLPGWLAEAAVGVASLGLYVATLAPSVQPADAGEFQLVATVLGIAHPPGYALYTMLGKLFTLLPFGDPAWRVNLFAGVCAAATLAILARTVRRATESAAAAVVSALALGLSPTFWAQGTFANIRSLTALFTALCFYWLLRYGEARARRYLIAFGLSFGLAVTHHSSLALLGLPFLAYLLVTDPRLPLQPRRWGWAAVGLCASGLVLLYLPLRSAMNPPFDTPSVRTLQGFVRHILALGFQGDFLYFLGRPELWQRFGVLGDILRLEFGVPLWLGALALGLYAGWRRPKWLLLWGGVAAVNTLAAITYRAPQTVEYLIPAYVALALGLGLGLGSLLEARNVWPAPALAGGLAAWLALSGGLAAYPSLAALHRDVSARDSALELLESAPPQALILSNWHWATPLWYLQDVEGLRRDVTVTYVYPEGATPNGEVWARHIEEAVPERPVLVTNRYQEFGGLPYRFVASGIGWRVESGSADALPAGLSGPPETLGGIIDFEGVRLGEQTVAPGGEVHAQVAWQANTPLDRNYSWFVHLVGPQGIAGQADLTYSPDRAPAGQTIVDDYRFPLRPDTPPGEYQLVAGVYITFDDGSWQRLPTAAGDDSITLGVVRVQPRPDPPATAHPLSVTWADGSRLVGVDYDDSVPGTRRMYLHWYRPAHAAQLDVTVSAWQHPEAVQVSVPGAEVAGYQTVACDVNPGAALASLSATSAGRPVPALGPWHRPQSAPSWTNRAPPAGARYLDLGGEMVLTGVHWQPDNPAPGALMTAELQFVAQRPLLNDYSVSLSLEGEGWRVQDDGTPALGAIPTLKWLAGWRVRDVRRLAVPAEAQGPAKLRLTVYDAFSLEPLPVGDDRLARQGQGVQTILWEGTLP